MKNYPVANAEMFTDACIHEGVDLVPLLAGRVDEILLEGGSKVYVGGGWRQPESGLSIFVVGQYHYDGISDIPVWVRECLTNGKRCSKCNAVQPPVPSCGCCGHPYTGGMTRKSEFTP